MTVTTPSPYLPYFGIGAGASQARAYARTQPLGDGGVSSLRPLVRDPNQTGVGGTGRLWSIGSRFSQLGYTDDDGVTFVAKSTVPDGLPVQGMCFSNNYLWLLTSSSAAPASGNVWRLPVPDVNGNIPGGSVGSPGDQWGTSVSAGSNGAALPQSTINIVNGNYLPSAGTVTVVSSAGPQLVTYTGKTAGTITGCTGGTGTLATGGAVSNLVRVFGLNNLTLGPAGAATAGGVNSALRNACFAVAADESNAYVCEYGTPNATYQIPALADGAMAAGSNRLYSASGVASSSMIGLTVSVSGAGAAGAALSAKINGVENASGSAVWIMSMPASTAVTGATITFPSTTYGAGVVVGGPSVYRSANPGAAIASVAFSKVVTFPGTKHAHAVKIIGGLPWVGLGDYSAQFPDTGLWVATSLAGATWLKRSVTAAGPAKDPINFFAATLLGQSVVLGESDNGLNDGPLLFPDATGTKARTFEAVSKIPQPLTQTMRGLTQLADGSLLWFGTGETGAVGPTSCVWYSKAPYTTSVLLEDVGSSMDSETVGDPLVSNGYAWFGTQRVVIPTSIGS